MENNKESKKHALARNDGISRRDFIAHAALVGAGLTTGAAWAAPQNEPTKTPSDQKASSKLGNERRKLGPLEVSGLGLGCMNIAWGFGPAP